MKKQWLMISLAIFILGVLVYLTVSTNVTQTFNPSSLKASSKTQQTKTKLSVSKNLTVEVTAPTPETKPEPPQKLDWPKPDEIKGVYATAWMAGSDKWFPRIINFINETKVNALVIDVKDDTGTLSYTSQIPLVNEINSSERKIRDPQKVFDLLKEHKIFPIARIVVFKDPYMAKNKPEWAVKDSNGGLWKDRKGLNWVDPHNQNYWDYIVDICKEAIEMGFQEIQFDYVRFTSDGDVKRCVYPYNNGKPAAEVIKDFLQYARTQLQAYHVPISADIFGLTTSANADLGIGQRFEIIAENVDVVCPMVYPSHYIPGNFGLKNPDVAPYETVLRSVSDAKIKLEQAGNTATTIRPWLQDFSLGSHYGRAQIQAQIKAVEDAGVKEWIFWNPSCRYDVEKYR